MNSSRACDVVYVGDKMGISSVPIRKVLLRRRRRKGWFVDLREAGEDSLKGVIDAYVVERPC